MLTTRKCRKTVILLIICNGCIRTVNLNLNYNMLTLLKSICIAVLKKAIKFYERYGFRFDGMEKEVMLGGRNTELRMVYRR